MRFIFVWVLFLLSAITLLADKPESNRIPRFVALKSGNIIMRVGPGYNYPIKWEYHRSHLPMEIIAEFEDWRKVRDKSGETGWMHKSMLSAKRYVLILEDDLIMHKNEEAESKPVARFQKDAIAQIVKCNALNCFLMVKTPASTLKGWAPRRALWGLYMNETAIK